MTAKKPKPLPGRPSINIPPTILDELTETPIRRKFLRICVNAGTTTAITVVSILAATGGVPERAVLCAAVLAGLLAGLSEFRTEFNKGDWKGKVALAVGAISPRYI